MHRTHTRVPFLVLLALIATPQPSCGGAGGSPGPDGAGQGLALLTFLQANQDNVALNAVLEFRFSEPVDPSTVHTGSLQIREGPAFGKTATGAFSVSGAIVRFAPRMPGLCDLSDAGLHPGREYRVLVVGGREAMAVRNTRGQPLGRTETYGFRTRGEGDPYRFDDEVPGALPVIIAHRPAEGEAAVAIGTVDAPQRIELTLSENLDPCTVTHHTVRVVIHEVGGSLAESVPAPNGRLCGFVTGGSVADRDPRDETWGSDTGSPWPGGSQTLPVSVHLLQEPGDTRIVISPLNGQDPRRPERGGVFPDNALVHATVGFGVTDLSGDPVVPFSMSFVTENVDRPAGGYTIENEGETPYEAGPTQADVNSGRAPGRVQAFLMFAGDGDNGTDPSRPSRPGIEGDSCRGLLQPDDGVQDHFDPESDFVFDTGPVNTCANATDGSTAVVWEFASLRIRSGVTVRVIGGNPAIFLVRGPVLIEEGARLLARGDGLGGSPRGRGADGAATTTESARGGRGVAGGGDGGTSPGGNGIGVARYSESGRQGYFFSGGIVDPSVFTENGPGCGHGNTSAHWTVHDRPVNRNSPGGGGGGHAQAGRNGSSLGVGDYPTIFDLPADGAGGATYGGPGSGALRTPEAGSGGGAGGELRPFANNEGRGTGGGGGAGGGFLDITALGDIQVFGTIDAAGSPGGNGAGRPFTPNYRWHPATGGGGGGSGGGVRLISRGNIELGPATLITTDGGEGGAGGLPRGRVAPVNPGGRGAVGRVVLEDADSVITNLSLATVIPAEGEVGFYRGAFDVSRFKGAGLSPQAVTGVFALGPLDPSYLEPAQDDFVVGAPAATSPGFGEVVLLIEARSFAMGLDGERAPLGSGYRTIGCFLDCRNPSAPTWHAGHPATVPRAADNVGHADVDNLASLDGDEFLQLRFTFFLASSVGPDDPGAFLDRWRIRFTSDH